MVAGFACLLWGLSQRTLSFEILQGLCPLNPPRSVLGCANFFEVGIVATKSISFFEAEESNHSEGFKDILIRSSVLRLRPPPGRTSALTPPEAQSHARVAGHYDLSYGWGQGVNGRPSAPLLHLLPTSLLGGGGRGSGGSFSPAGTVSSASLSPCLRAPLLLRALLNLIILN